MSEDNPWTAYANQALREGIVSDDDEAAFGALGMLFEHYRDKPHPLLQALARTDWLDDKIRTAASGLTPRQQAYEDETGRLRLMVEVAKADGVRDPIKKVAERHGIPVKTLKQRLWRDRRDHA